MRGLLGLGYLNLSDHFLLISVKHLKVWSVFDINGDLQEIF